MRLAGAILVVLGVFGLLFQPLHFSGKALTFRAPRLHRSLDRQGGVSIVLEAQPTPQTPVTDGAMEAMLKVIRNRVDQLGVAEPSVFRQGRDRIAMELRGIENPQRAIELITKRALLEFVDTGPRSLPQGAEWKDNDTVVLPDDKTTLKVPRKVILTGADLVDARGQFDPYGRPNVAFTFKSSAAKKFEDYTAQNIGKYLTIVLDNRVISSPVINSPIPGGRGVIEGGFTIESARDLAMLLRGGSLPLPVQVVGSEIVGPSLTHGPADRDLRQWYVAMVLVGLFMFFYFRPSREDLAPIGPRTTPGMRQNPIALERTLETDVHRRVGPVSGEGPVYKEGGMEITLSRDQFATLLNAVYLGTWMVNSIRQPENEVREFAEFERYLLSLAHGSGFTDRVEFDPTRHHFSYARRFEEALEPFIDEYEDNALWDGLVDGLARRDFEETYGDAVERMDEDEQLEKLQVFVDKYETEFDEHGTDRLRITTA